MNLEFSENTEKLSQGILPENLKYPLVIDLSFSLDDPEMSEVQEMVKGHGGTNIKLSIRSQFIPYGEMAVNFSKEYINEWKFHMSGKTRTFFDVVVDLTFEDRGMEENIEHWRNQMNSSSFKFIEFPKEIFN